jgi:hypothetical protein
MMRQAPTARKVLLLALVLLPGCQDDGGSWLLGWGWGLVGFISLPVWGRRVMMKGWEGCRKRCVSLSCRTPEHVLPALPAFGSESVFQALYLVASQA